MNTLNAIQTFIGHFQVLFVSLGVPILTVLISWFVAAQTNRTSRRLAEKERALEVQLKLAEFRQNWINGLRDDLASYAAATFNTPGMPIPEDHLREIITLGARIRMRMNPLDPDYDAFMAALSHSLPSSEKEAEAAKTSASVAAIGQRMLKREWERLKADLADIERAQK
jgi:hypothetical protein